MSKDNSITLDEWVNELIAADPKANEQGQSVKELMASSGRGKDYVSKVLNAAKAAGRLEMSVVFRERLDGRTASVPVYRILAKE